MMGMATKTKTRRTIASAFLSRLFMMFLLTGELLLVLIFQRFLPLTELLLVVGAHPDGLVGPVDQASTRRITVGLQAGGGPPVGAREARLAHGNHDDLSGLDPIAGVDARIMVELLGGLDQPIDVVAMDDVTAGVAVLAVPHGQSDPTEIGHGRMLELGLTDGSRFTGTHVVFLLNCDD